MKLASLIALLTLPTASWSYGGEKCNNPNSRRRNSENCQSLGNDQFECRITGQSRRRIGKIGSYFCLDGLWQNVWYTDSTTEAACQANVTANIIGSMVRDFNFDTQESSAVQRQSKAGQCFSNTVGRRRSPVVSHRYTCQGVPNGQNFITQSFEGDDCSQSSLFATSNTTGDHDGQLCFCNSDDGRHTPTSDCASCDTSEIQCSDEARCGNARNKLCTWSGDSCSCASGNYKNTNICFGGALHDVYFESSTYAACANMVAGAYMKFPAPTSGRRRGGANTCSGTQGTIWNGSESVQYLGDKELDCTGVQDGQKARRTYFSDSACTQQIYSQASWSDPFSTCACMRAEEQIKSECESCSGSECSTQDSCAMTDEGTCAWTSAANPQCSCATNILKNEQHCWGEEAYDFVFDNVADGLTKCANGDHASATVKRYNHDALDDGSWVNCQQLSQGERTGAKANATHYKESSCKSVANGQKSKKAYFSDDTCTTLVTTEESSGGSIETCKCELFNGCKANTKFEKYYCATGAADSQIIAVEYTDSTCTTPTGVNNTYTSVTDAMNPGVCAAWEPIALRPDFRMSVILTCKAAGGHPWYHTWMRTNFDSMAPSCGSNPADLTTAQSSGPIQDCYCKQELYFLEIAAAQNVQVTGNVQMTVSDVAAAIVDKVFKKLLQNTIAESCGVKPSNIVGLVLSALAVGGRRLAAGGIKADYVIVVPKTQESNVVNAVSTTTTQSLSSSLQTKVQNSNVAFTATVTEKSTPTSAPATVAASSDGSIDTAGVDASGNALGTPLGASTTTTTTTPSGGSASSADTFAPSTFLLACAILRVAIV